MGTVHGGVLMTFADYTLCAVGKTGSDDESIVTVSLTTEFLLPATAGVWLTGTGTIHRRTGSLVFVQGRLCQGDDVVLTFSGIGKRIRGGS
jgi:acyl-coenzyme A thioesterase PaaI-like protein